MKKNHWRLYALLGLIIVLALSFWGFGSLLTGGKEGVAPPASNQTATAPPVQNTQNTGGDESGEGDGKTETALICSMVVRCDSLIGNDKLSKDKQELVPKDGIIYQNESVVFYEGENLIDLLTREMKEQKIHLDFAEVPAFNSVYVTGINNIYEFDCGDMSGWMFKVNGEFSDVGASQYILKEGDKAEWIYSCDLMSDMGF